MLDSYGFTPHAPAFYFLLPIGFYSAGKVSGKAQTDIHDLVFVVMKDVEIVRSPVYCCPFVRLAVCS